MKVRYLLPFLLLLLLLPPQSACAEVNSQINVNTSGEGNNSTSVHQTIQSSSTNNSTSQSSTDITTTVNGVTKTFHSDKGANVHVETVNGETKIEVDGEDQTPKSHDIIVTPSVSKEESVEGVATSRIIVQTTINPDEFLVVEPGAIKVLKASSSESSSLLSLLKKLFSL